MDIYTREVLEDALLEFEGTILCVSHDRFFVNKIATSFIDMGNNEEADQKNEKTSQQSLLISKQKKKEQDKGETKLKKNEWKMKCRKPERE